MYHDTTLTELCVPKKILQPLYTASNSSSSNLEESLSRLIEIARATEGRSALASKNILSTVLDLCHHLSCHPSSSQQNIVLLSLKLLRNLSAGEIINQNSFIEQNGVQTICNVLKKSKTHSDYYGVLRMGLQLLGNVSLAGEKHKLAVWKELFPEDFLEISRLRRREICDPLCMVIYTCFEGNNRLIAQICSGEGLTLLAEIVRTALAAGFEEDWLKLLFSKICVEESQLAQLFARLCPVGDYVDNEVVNARVDHFVPEQALLLSIISEILNDKICEITISHEFASFVNRVLESAIVIVDSIPIEQSSLPTGSSDIDVLGYSLIILRDICALDHTPNQEGSIKDDVVDSLLSLGILDLLLKVLNDLEPPAIIKKAVKKGDSEEGTRNFFINSYCVRTLSIYVSNQLPDMMGCCTLGKLCPYKGFRRDVVAIIGNCAYRRKKAQDLIREKNGILLMLQQCVTDEDNPFLREWGIWSVRNLLEGNLENQRVVSELELQGSVDVPEITRLGLRVVVDQKTQRAKLVNVSSS